MMVTIDLAQGLDLAISDNVAWLTINRPEKKNAVTQEMWRSIADVLGAMAHDTKTVRAFVLTGAGSDFCAGADIGEFETVRRDAGTARAYERANSDAFAAIRLAPFPTIAAIRGICFGGGFGLAAACDIRLATDDAVFSVPAARLGLAYPQDAMIDIVSSAGLQMAKYLAFSAARIGAAQALSAGFLLEVTGKDELDARCSAIAAQIAENAPLSVRASKASIRAVVTGDTGDAQTAKMLGDVTFDSADYAEGRAAFLARRKPVFKGE